MKSRSINPSLIATCSSPFASAPSVPGVSCRCRSALRAVIVRRGSETISLPPFFCCASKYCMIGGIVAAGLAPAKNTASACGISARGNGIPRSIPNALIPAAAAEAMQNRPL